MLSDQLVSAWANFARTGNPNGQAIIRGTRYTVGTDRACLADPRPAGSVTLTDAQYVAPSPLRLLGLGGRETQ